MSNLIKIEFYLSLITKDKKYQQDLSLYRELPFLPPIGLSMLIEGGEYIVSAYGIYYDPGSTLIILFEDDKSFDSWSDIEEYTETLLEDGFKLRGARPPKKQ